MNSVCFQFHEVQRFLTDTQIQVCLNPIYLPLPFYTAKK